MVVIGLTRLRRKGIFWFNVIGKTIIHLSTAVNVGILGCYSSKFGMYRNTERLRNFSSLKALCNKNS